jgi:hypothetical protein
MRKDSYVLQDKKVKGTIVVDIVRAIRSMKETNWNQYLKPEDWNYINKRILPSEWYPLDFVERCGRAVFQVAAQGNPDMARFAGRMRGKVMFEGIYKTVITPHDPMDSLSRFAMIYGQLYNFASVTFKEIGKGHAQFLKNYDFGQKGGMWYCCQFMGQLDTLVELAGGTNIKIELIAKQWEGAPVTIFDITWE